MAFFKNSSLDSANVPYFGEYGKKLASAEKYEDLYNMYPTGRRNLISNGSMIVNQKFEEYTNVTGYGSANQNDEGKEGPDRWHLEFPTNRYTLTIRRGTSDPAPGFVHYFETELQSASNMNPDGSNDYIWVVYKLPGDDMTSMFYGTQHAKPSVVSFWVRSAHVGQHALNVYAAGDPSATRIVTRSFTIGAPNVWEKKFISIPPNYETYCAGRGNSTAIWLQWGINNGASRTGGQQHTGWSSFAIDDYMEGGRSNSLVQAGDKFAITGVQWEAGDIPTPFEYRTYAEELQNCQRFLWRVNSIGGATRIAVSGNYSGTNAFPTLNLPVPLRTDPTLIWSNNNAIFTEYLSGGQQNVTGLSNNTRGQANSSTIQNLTIGALHSGNLSGPVNLLLRGTAGQDFFELNSEL